MLKQLLIIISIVGISFAQIQHEGTPKYFDSQMDVVNFINIDKTNRVDRNFHPMVFQFGNEYDVDINFLSEATVINGEEFNTYLLGIESRDAYSIALNFNQFNLTENSELYIYDEEKTSYLGSFDSSNNKVAGNLTTTGAKSDRVIIELNVPENELNDLQLNIDTVIHDYTDIYSYYNSSDGNREDCNINVICSEGDDFRDQIDGVVRVTMGGGLCSGSIVNNTANDRTPYMLFADHCVGGSASGYVFHFNYQSTSCNGTSGSLGQSISGSEVLASEDINSGPDFALLRITTDIPESYNPFWVGWSRSSNAPTEAVGIHHPGADIKKISFTNDNVSANGYFWEFQYDEGRVIPGSSGSPFFDQNKRQVGIASYIYTNYCDPSPDCYCDQQYNHGYGRFDLSWNLGMAPYLDPLNTGVETLDGISISGLSIIHDSFEDMPYEDDSITFSANVTAFTGDIEGVELYYNIGDGYQNIEMQQQGFGSIYEIDLEGIYNGMIIEYYIQAVNSEGIVETFPSNAPENSIVFIIGDLPDLYFSDFELNAEGWIAGDALDDATAGIWELAIPVATFNDDNFQVQPGEDYTEEGSYCFITGNGYEEGNGGFDDVDGGKTTLISPVFNLSGVDEVVLTYWRWYTNNVGDNGDNDKWTVSVSNNSGVTWQALEYTGASDASWSKKRFILSNHITLNENVQFRFIAEDIFYDGDAGTGGSLVEAAIDDFLLEYLSDGSGIEGDVNNDGAVDVLDVVILVNVILGFEPPPPGSDVNLDGTINIQDIVTLINIILNQ